MKEIFFSSLGILSGTICGLLTTIGLWYEVCEFSFWPCIFVMSGLKKK